MPPKTAPKKSGVATKKGKGGAVADSAPPTGLFQPSAYPVWNDDEIESEDWGDASTPLYEHTPTPPNVPTFGTHLKEWKRPAAVFSPFKPIVVRPNLQVHPYQDEPPVDPTQQANNITDADRRRRVAVYRHVKTLKDAGPHVGPNKVELIAGRKRQQRRSVYEPTPNFMLAFNSAIMTVAKMQRFVPPGNYLWELVYPQQALSGYKYPVYNPSGKYAVKLFWCGAWRRVVLDDRLPTDIFSRCMLTVTDAKEIWPAILAKAMQQVLTPLNEGQLFSNPTWCVSTLLGGWLPQSLDPVKNTALALKYIRAQTNAIGKSAELPELYVAFDPSTLTDKKGKPRAPSPVKKEDKGKGGKVGADTEAEDDLIEEQHEMMVLCATCGDPTAPVSGELLKPSEEYEEAGLQPENAYLLVDAVPYESTTLLRLVSPFVNWTKSVEPERPVSAGADFAIGLSDENDWNDFWLTWEQFVEYFSRLHVFRNVTTKRYACSHQITAATVATQQAESNVAQALHDGEPVPESAKPQETYSRCLYIKASSTINLLFAFTGLFVPVPATPAPTETLDPKAKGGPKKSTGDTSPTRLVLADHPDTPTTPLRPVTAPPPDRPAFEASVSLLDWKTSCPLKLLHSFGAKPGVTNSFVLQVPPGEHAYKIDLRNLPVESLFAVLSSREVPLVEEMELFNTHLNLAIWVDAGEYAPHLPNEWTCWFKRYLSVKQETGLVAELSLLPPNTDLDSVRIVPQDKDPKKKKPPAGEKGKKEPTPKKSPRTMAIEQRASIEEAPIENSYRTAIGVLSYMQLSLINCDTNKIQEGVVGRIPYTRLEANRTGYVLAAYGTTPTHFPAGLFKLQITSDQIVDRIDTIRHAEHTILRDGIYAPNPQSQLFKYNITAHELTVASLFLQIADDSLNVPCTVALLHNNEVVFELRDVVGQCSIPNFWFWPADKTAQNKYTVVCTLNQVVAANIQHNLHTKAVQSYQKQKELQLQGNFTETITVPISPAPTSPVVTQGREKAKSSTVGPVPKVEKGKSGKKVQAEEVPNVLEVWGSRMPGEDEVFFCLKLICSTNRLLVEADTSLIDEINTIKLAWAKPDGFQEVTEKGGKVSKDAAKNQEKLLEMAQQRMTKSKDIRDRFLANVHALPPKLDDNAVSPMGTTNPPSPRETAKGERRQVRVTSMPEDKSRSVDPAVQEERTRQLHERDAATQAMLGILKQSEERAAQLKALRHERLAADKARKEKLWASIKQRPADEEGAAGAAVPIPAKPAPPAKPAAKKK
eukprot:TRINITY_DN53784_c0_g1_i1.p1 TRINITY_DN53784_c0_g1~~TRINITY_DN53784_c0_g1_i1.p1  ORF type:complete len:1269 (+),score=278.53 TRINITY_DN53784_c0_g1_i1:100-3906(+)